MAQEKKLSVEGTHRTKVIFPVVYFAALLPFAVSYLKRFELREAMPGLTLLLLMALLGLLAMKYFLWDLADEVHDLGDALRVRRRDVEEVVPLANVQDVTYTNMRPPRMTLHLIKAGRLGGRISFTPSTKRKRNPFAKHPLMEELAMRAWRARNGADAPP